MTPGSHLRISDADRQEVADVLTRHATDGRLDQVEFEERLERALRAKTRADLAGLLHDLPDAPYPALGSAGGDTLSLDTLSLDTLSPDSGAADAGSPDTQPLVRPVGLPPATTSGQGAPRPHRAAWTTVGLVIAALFIVAGAFSFATATAAKAVHSQRSWSGAVDSLDLDIGVGSVTLVGTDRPGALVQADGTDGLTTPTNSQSLVGGKLRIRSTCALRANEHFSLNAGNNRCSLSYRISLPAGTTVVARTLDGRIDASRLTGTVSLTSGDGRVSVNSPAGAVTAHSNDGQVRVTGATARSVTATTNDGAIHVGFAKPPEQVTAHSNDGSVTIGLPDTPDAYRVDAHSNDGRVSVTVRTHPSASRTITATSGDGRITVRYGSAF